MWENARGSDTSLLRLQQIIKGRYGKGLRVLPLMEISERHLSDKYFNSGLDIHIPIIVNQNYLGTAVIQEGKDLLQDELSTLVDTVKMVLEPSLYSKWLSHREENLAHVSQLDFAPEDNLILFNDLESKYFDVSHKDQDLENLKLVSNLIHLHGKNDFFIKRVAYQIHEMSHRWALLPLQDMKELRTIEDLLSLGAVTIHADKIESLSKEHQALLVEYFSQPRSSNEPLVITSSGLTLSELNTTSIDQDLIEEMTYATFEVDRAPLSFLDLKEILEMMFFETSQP